MRLPPFTSSWKLLHAHHTKRRLCKGFQTLWLTRKTIELTASLTLLHCHSLESHFRGQIHTFSETVPLMFGLKGKFDMFEGELF